MMQNDATNLETKISFKNSFSYAKEKENFLRYFSGGYKENLPQKSCT